MMMPIVEVMMMRGKQAGKEYGKQLVIILMIRKKAAEAGDVAETSRTEDSSREESLPIHHHDGKFKRHGAHWSKWHLLVNARAIIPPAGLVVLLEQSEGEMTMMKGTKENITILQKDNEHHCLLILILVSLVSIPMMMIIMIHYWVQWRRMSHSNSSTYNVQRILFFVIEEEEKKDRTYANTITTAITVKEAQARQGRRSVNSYQGPWMKSSLLHHHQMPNLPLSTTATVKNNNNRLQCNNTKKNSRRRWRSNSLSEIN
mmetsp:Transcript_28492/g.60701  ORF Transcript_28492/g.60701 Transcript_28492/m.60701 type:complete len:259 (+) Transcript_28492:634-1410(+)